MAPAIGLRCARRNPPTANRSEADVLARVGLFAWAILAQQKSVASPSGQRGLAEEFGAWWIADSAMQKAHLETGGLL